MKKIVTLLVLGIILSTQTADAQGYVNYNRKWFLGLNLGGTYHSNTEVDVNHLYRGGAGFTLGKSFNYNKGNLLSFDLRVRYLIAAYRGLSTENFMLDSTNYNFLGLGDDLQQYQTDYGFYKPNFHSWVNDWSLELQINTNLLREKTGWNLFVFGGIGTVRYHTTIDLYDNDVSFQIKPLDKLDEKKVYAQDYETNVVDKRTWMPSFGAGISKQITPNVAFEIMGRMTWTRNNDFDAMPYNIDGTVSQLNDRYHYVSAGFKFRLGWRENTYTANNTHHNNTNSNNNNTPCETPEILSVSPSNNVTVTNSNIQIKASIKGRSNGTKIKLYQNNAFVGYMGYDHIHDVASRSTELTEGVNTIKIVISNDCGTDEETISINYEKDTTPPCVFPSITNVSPTNNSTTTNGSINVTALINNYNNGHIRIYNNNSSLGSMNYDTTTHIASKTINLSVGNNDIKIKVSNDCGTKIKTIHITYKRDETPCTTPTISTVSPVNNTTVSNSSIQVNALINGYTNGTSIKLYKNNILQGNMSYNASTHIASKTVNLSEGNNSIRIVVSNACGSNKKTINIIYKKEEEPCTAPSISTVTPVNNSILSNQNVQISAVINNYTNGTSIKLYKGNQFLGNMLYNASTHKANKNVALSVGLNTFKIVVSNACGTNDKIIKITYKRGQDPCDTPTIGYVSPQPNTTLTNDNVTIEAQINNYTPGTSIKLYKNNMLVGNMVYNASTGIASKSVVLTEGNNNYKIKVSNSCGNNQSSFTLIYKNNTPCTPPTIGITSPLNNTTLTTSSINVDAVINNYTIGTTIQLFQNNTLVGNMTYNPVTHKAIKAVTLVQGNNSFKVKVSNTCGNDEKSFNVVYKGSNPIPCYEPTATPFSPQNTSITQSDANITLKIKTTNITSNTQIEVTHNNSIIPFSFNAATQMITININNLSYGANTIKTTVTNNCGNDKLIYNITRERCKLPVISFNSSGTTTNSTYIINATILNLDDADLISLNLNGTPHSFNFNENTGKLLSTLTLQPGNNTISLRVTKCKEIIKNFNVIYTSPCNAPTINITSADTSVSPTYVFKANITNIDNANDLTVKHNGNVVNSIYTPANGQLKAYLTLIEGVNTIQVIANGCETVTKEFKVTYNKPCITPTITLTSDTTSTSSTYTLTVTIGGDVTQSDINVISTGGNTPIGWIDFNKNLHQLTSTVTLVDGQNTITITVNGCETVTETFVINYDSPCNGAPTITLPNKANADPGDSTFSAKAILTGITNESQVNVKINGQSSSFIFTTVDGQMGLEAEILPYGYGTYNIEINADNGCGTDTKTFTIVRAQASTKGRTDGGGNHNNDYPIINGISPKSPTSTVNSSTYLFKAKVENVSSKRDIKVFVNGMSLTTFVYSSSSKQVSSVVRLKKGQNTIRIEATNKNGKDIEDYIIIYKVSNAGTRPNTGRGNGKPKTGTTKPKSGSGGSSSSGKSTKTGSKGTKGNGSKSSGTTIKSKTGSKTKSSGKSSRTTTKPKTGKTTKTKTGSTGTTINKGGR